MTPFKKDILKKMISAAQKAQENSYSPYSNHPVGAAILTEDGKIYAGCNVETTDFKTICAEQNAVSSMIAQAGNKKIAAVFVIGPTEHVITPCGNCRQTLYEFGTSDTTVLCCNNDQSLSKETSLGELLPFYFNMDKEKAEE